jgi:hypothetical protein
MTCCSSSSCISSCNWQVVESQPRDADSEEGRAVRVSRLTLVDLAGSERLGKTGVHRAVMVVITFGGAVSQPDPSISAEQCS